MDASTLAAIISILAVILAGYAVFQARQAGQQITLESSVEAIKEAVPVATELMAVAQIAVNSAEQLKRTGKINSNDEAFNYALTFVKKWIPASANIKNEDIVAAINAGVLVASALTHQIEAAKVAVDEAVVETKASRRSA